MSKQVGDLARISAEFRNLAGTLTDPTTVSFKYRTPAGVETTFVYGTDPEVARASTGSYFVDLDLTEIGRWAYMWTATGTVQGTESGAFPVGTSDLEDSPLPRFATTAELAAMLAVEFTTAQETQAGMLLDLATGAIIQAVDKTDEWALALTSVPTQLKLLALTLARRMYLNPQGVRSQSEQLGSYQHTESFADASTGIDLTTSERLSARRCVYGSNTASPRIGSIIDNSHVQEQYDGDLYPDAWWVGDES